ncbi:MAG: hypothetical protein FWD81_06240 [Methanomassiliicoccaceae archaeon]|jgi:hypothetical protein|nr:hypothetical protein [Methanomassiliicoccaceae archaeon]
MDEKPTTVWAIILIVLAVGLYYLLYEGLWAVIQFNSAGAGDLGIAVGIIPIVLGVLTLLVAFMVYGRNGKTFLTILLVLAILGNLIMILMLFAAKGIAEDLIGETISIATFVVIYGAQLVLAIVVFMLLQRQEVRTYFKS